MAKSTNRRIIETPVIPAEEIQNAEVISSKLMDTENVLTSKRYVKGALQFITPAELLKTTLEIFEKEDCNVIIKGSEAVKVAEEDGTENVSFGRVNLLANYKIDEEISYEIGILTAFDLSSPKLKLYRGAKTNACLNLNVWGAEDIIKVDVSNGINLTILKGFIEQIGEQVKKSRELVDTMKAKKLLPEQVPTLIGDMLFKTISEKYVNGTTTIVQAAQHLTNPESKYYYKREGFNYWDLYNAFTENFNARIALFDIPEKSAAIFAQLGI